MQIYLLRHGIAEDPKPGQRDADRALTPEGKKRLRAIVKRARAADVTPGLILTSPLRRAVESAQIAAAVLEYKGDLLRTKALMPESSPEAVWEEIRVHKTEEQLLLAGHEPLFSSATAYLLNAPSLVVDFKKGALIRIDVEQLSAHPRGVLRWMLASKLA
jgi:phosphohistidine phosphatase